jgi:restriction endonuclease S subunit
MVQMGEIVEGKNGILSSTMAKIVPNNIVTRYLYWFLKGIEKFFKIIL